MPTADQVEQVFDVTLRVTDEHGAYAAQPYKVYVMPQPGNHPPIIISEPSEYFETADPPRSDQGEVSPTSINLHLEDGQTESRTVYVTPSASGIYADVFLNFDDTGSCTYFAPKVTREFPLIINALLNDPELADVNFAFGVGRFEEYSSFAGEYDVGRPFILNSPMIAASDPEFMDAIDEALRRKAPGYGGDAPETLIEALYQIATGEGFDANANGSTLDSGKMGWASTQVTPGNSGDVPRFNMEEYEADPDPRNHVFAPAGTRGGVGFRYGALPIVIAASDVGTAYQPDVPEIDPILGVRDENGNPVEVDLARFQAEDTSRPSTFQGRGAKIQETVDALVDLGALVIGLGAATGPPGEGWGTNPALDPRQDLEALAELTGAVNGSDDTIPSGIAGDPIEPGDQFYFFAGTVGWASENDPVAGGDHFCYRNVNYDSADPSVILNVLDNDWDVDGDRLKITRITQAPSQGTVEISLHRDYLIYTPPAGGFVDTNFKYEISDGHFQDEGTVAIDETPYGSYGYGQTGSGNDYLCYRNVNRFDPVHVYLMNNDWDSNGDELRITGVSQPSQGGTAAISSAGDYVIFTPPSGGFVDDSFTYTISDGQGHTATGTVNLDDGMYGGYAGAPPTAVDDSLHLYHMHKGSPVELYVLGNDMDQDHDPLTITGVTQPAHGTVQISTRGDHLVYTPPQSGFVEETFTYTVSDGDEGQDTATVTLDDGMYGGYAGPTALSGFGAGIVEAIKSSLTRVKFNVECVASDDTVLFQSTPDVQRGVSPLEQVSFQTQFTGDGFRHSFDVLFVREGTNVILGSIPVTIDDDYRYDVDAIDPDDDPVTYHLDTEISPAEATIDEQSGKIRWVPPEPGQYPFRVYARDNRGGEDFQDFTVTVSAGAPNQAPEITSVARTDAAVGRPYVYQVEAEDGDGDRLAHYLQPYQQETVPEGMSIDRVTGRLTWTPISADAASVTVRVLDGRGKEDTEDIVFDVAAWLPNSDPQITTIPDTGAVVGQELSLPVAVSDAESDPIALDLPLKPIGMSIDPLDGRIVWTPTADQLGKHDVLVRARDGQGGVGLEWFAVNVSATNVAPQITSTPPAGPAVVGRTYEYRVEAQDANGNAITLTLDTASTTRGIQITTDATTKVTYLRWTPLPGDIGGPYGITITASDGTLDDTQSFSLSAVAAPANGAPTFDTTALPSPTGVGLSYATQVKATDPDGDVLKYFLDAGPEGMTIDLTSGVLSWTPDADDLGTHDVIVSVSDGRGSRVAEDFSLTVEENPLNHAPTIGTTSLPGPTAVGVAYEGPIAASDSDGDRLTYSLDQTSRDRGMSIDQSGLLQWPTTGAVGTYPVTVTVDDGRGGTASSQGFSVTVATSPVNHPPQVGTAPIPSPTGVGILYQAQIVATDPDGDPLSFSLDPTSEGKGMTMVGDLLTWTPTAAQKGSHSITVTVSDGRGGSEQKACSLEVVDGVNVPPEITSTPRLRVRAGQKYLYAVEAFDANGDGLTFTLEESPTGATYPMTIHPVTHVISWQTTAAEAGNPYPVRVRVSDGLAYAVQSFDVEVITAAANADPEIVSTPPLDALLGELYQYRLEADDPDGDMLQWTLVKGPAGMSLHPYSGVLAWVPTKDQIKPQDVVVKVADPYGGSDTQSFTIIPRAVNLGPSITSVPPTSVVVDQLYVYAIRAVDPDDDAISFSLTESPAHDEVTHADAMTINTTTGEITWLPSQAQLEANGGVHYVTVVATANGLSAGQRYRVVVRPANHAPVITSNGPESITAGLVYGYDVQVTDLDLDPIRFALLDHPEGMTIDPYGRVRWTTTAADVNTDGYPVEIVAFDDRGEEDREGFSLKVLPDVAQPQIDVQILPSNPIEEDREVTFVVSAVDNVGVETITLTVDGEPVSINGAGVGHFTPTAIGEYEIVARATDAADNYGEYQGTLTVSSADPAAPDVAIASPVDDQEGKHPVVTAPVNATGCIADDDMKEYTLSVLTMEGKVVKAGTPVSTPQTGIGSESNPAVLGQFDPTMLANGPYILQVQATDLGNHVTTTEQIVNVSGSLKLGDFKLSFTDLTVPVAGIPINVNRTYDTLRANEEGDFGYGWQLDFGEIDVAVDFPDGELPGFGAYPAFYDGTRVTITREDGTTEGFTFKPWEEDLFFGIITVWHPYFQPDPGVTSRLEVPDRRLDPDGAGGFIDWDAGAVSYNPADPGCGGTYTHRAIDGIRRKMDAESGDLLSMSERHGNELTFSSDAITSNRGRKLDIDRDGFGRITEITDPKGNSVSYRYDTAGNLIRVYNRLNDPDDSAAKFVGYTYLTDPEYPHYMGSMTDQLGRTTTTVAYGTDGRLDQIADAFDKAINFDYNTSNLTQTATFLRDDLSVETTTVTYDSWGNVTRAEDAAGQVILHEYLEVDGVKTYLASETRVVGAEGGSDDLVTTYGSTTADYDQFGNPKVATDPAGNKTYYSYNSVGQVTAVTDASGSTTRYGYDFGGYYGPGSGEASDLRYKVDPSGATTMFKYDEHGNVTEVRSSIPFNNFSWYDIYSGGYYGDHYNPYGGPLDPAYRPTTRPEYAKGTLEYAEVGDLVKTTDPDAKWTKNVYDALGNRELSYRWWSDPADPENPAQLKTLVDRTVYDAEGRATGTKRYEISGHVDYTAGADLDGQTPRFETSADYNDLGRVDQTTDRYANPTETTYDKGGRAIQTRTRTKDLAGNDKWLVTRTEYDEEGRPLYVTDRYVEPTDGTCPPVFGTHTVYDSVGRVVRVERLQNMAIDITGSDLDKRASRSTTYPGSVVSTTQSHFADGRVDYTLDERGARTEYTYDASGQVIESRREVKDENGVPRWLVTRSFYDAASQTAVTMDAFVEGVTTVFTGTRILYDKGYAVASEGRQGVVIDMDRNGPHPKAVLTSLGTLIWSSETFYDDVGRVKKSVGRHAPGVQGPASEYEYGTAGRQTATVGPAVYDPITQKYVRHRSETKYDDQGRVKETWDNIRVELDQSGNPGAPVYTSKHVTASGYDEFGRAVRTTYNDGSYTETGYDSYGRLAWEKDQMGHVTDYTYDTLGRLVEVKLPSVPDPLNSGTPTRPTYTYRYDQFGNHVQTIDPYNHVTETAYDAQGRQIARTLPIGTSTPGNPNDFVERKHYSDRSLSEAQAAGESLSLSVALGQLAYEVSFEGMVTAYRYDNSAGGNGRLARTYYYEGPTAEADYLAAVADGQLTQADRLTAYTDDASGRRTKVVQDGDGNLGTESDQRVVSNTYDPHGRLLSVASPEGTLHSEYDAVTGLHTRTWTGTNPASPTTDTWYVYDTLGRLSREVYDSFDGTRDFAADYTLDLAGNRTSKKTDFQPTSEQLASYRTGGALAADETTSYSYDANDRLLTEAKDLAGTTDDRFTVYAYGTGNSGTQQTAKTVCQGLASGGLLKEQAIYVYDVRGRMSQAQVDADGSGGFETTTSYEYDDSGIRVSQTVNGTKTVYLNDANNPTGYAQVLEEKNAAGTVQKSYVLGQDVISQATSASVVHYLLYDGHGSTRALLDAQGSVVVNGATPQVFAYDAYGNPVGFDPATALTGLLYSGERTDPATGLQYLRARYYAPATGRMTTFDPFPGNSDDPISLHRYLYASAAPTAFVDPSGKFSLTCTLASMGIANTLRTLHTEAVSFVFGAVQATVQGMEAGLTPNQIFVQYLLDEVFPIVGLLYSVGKWALEVMEAGIFLEARDSDLAADMYSVSEEAAVDWIHSGGPLEEEDPASASGPGGTPASLSAASFSASAAGSALGGATGALRSVRRNGRLVTAGLKNILRSGLRKIPVMSYGELRAHNLKEGLSDLIQKNHLNQDRAFRELGIPRNQGLCINLKGHATVPGTSHNKFHTAMDNHWDLVRANKRPATAGAYNEAMHKALLNAGYDGETADAITQLAMKQQAGYNIKPSTVFPYIPESFT